MASIPKLSNNEVQDLAAKIPSGTERSRFLIINALFNQGSGYSSFDSFADRLNAYTADKKISEDEKLIIADLTSEILKHFRDIGVLSYADYDHEYNKCNSILSP